MKSAISLMALLGCLFAIGCRETQTPSATNVGRAKAEIATGADGLTVEQRNVKRRLEMDNDIGSVKHLYVISAYSGQVLLYSTVKGKVTSSGKRLTPSSVHVGDGNQAKRFYGYDAPGGRETPEVLGDDGTYGSSIEYLYWFDQADVYRQHYVQGGQIIHISDKPTKFGSIQIETINAESK
jgi:hypothetical protein